MSPPGRRQLRGLDSIATIAAVVLVAYAGALPGEFVFDDHLLIVENEALHSPGAVPGYFTRGTWPSTGTGRPDTALYRPLLLLTLFLVYQAAGPLAVAFHMVNVALHAANAVLVLLLLRRLAIGSERAVWLGALVFAVHPLHVESVAWISGVIDVLLTFFVLLAVLLYARPSTGAYVGALACSALALLTKETAAVFPLLALAHDRLVLGRARWARVGGLVAVVVVYLGVRRATLGAIVIAPSVSGAAMLRALNYTLGYVTLTLAPTQLGIYLSSPDRVVGAVSALVAVAVVIGALVWAARDRLIGLALVWFAATLAPALFLVFIVDGMYAQRFLYLPSVAVALLSARATGLALAHSPRVAPASVAVPLVLLGATMIAATHDWHDDGVVLVRAAQNTPSFAGVHWTLARYYERVGRPNDAVSEYLEAARLAPRTQRALIYNSLGRVYLATGDTERSLSFHTRELELRPASATALIGIGNAHVRRGDFARAAKAFQAAWEADHTQWEALYNWALALVFLGDGEEARRHFTTFVNGAPPERYAAALADARQRLTR